MLDSDEEVYSYTHLLYHSLSLLSTRARSVRQDHERRGVAGRLPHECGRKDRSAHGTYRTRDLILGYYDAYAAGTPTALQTWLGPEEKRTARRHSGQTRA